MTYETTTWALAACLALTTIAWLAALRRAAAAETQLALIKRVAVIAGGAFLLRYFTKSKTSGADPLNQ